MRSLTVLFSLSLLLIACGDDDTGPSECTGREDCSPGEVCVDRMCMPATDTGAADTGTDAPVDTNPSSDTSVPDTGDGCADECSDEEVCIDGACCAAASVCEDICCGGGQVCSFARCVDIGAECLSEEDCNDGEYCESLLGESGGATCGDTTIASGRCLPRPPSCPDGTEPDPANPTCVTSCSYTPPAEAFDVMELYSWGTYDGDRAAPNATDIRNSPIVVQMDDDDCDGRITARDTADIIVITSPNDTATPRAGDLVVLEVEDGALVERWRAQGVHPHSYPAAGNIDDAPGNEIVACLSPVAPDGLSDRNVVAFHLVDGDLEELWRADPAEDCGTIKLADLDQDGTVEVLAGSAVIDGVTGTIEHQLSGVSRAVMMDVDGDADGRLEIVSGTAIWRLSADDEFERIANIGINSSSHPLVADLEPGGLPEIVSVNTPTHSMYVWRYNPDAADGFTMIREGLDINGRLNPELCAEGSAGRTRGGGPPTASDVNADGVPDIAVAGGVGYAVLDGALLMDPAVPNIDTFFWADQTVDCSSAQTGSSVFDFNGDGRAEVLYADEHTFRIYEGTGDGAGGARVLFDACSTNGTILEMPIVADVDADGQADILVVSNARYRACLDDPEERVSGIRVYGNSAGSWVRTRSVWNQHDYHITNVNDDGSIPRVEARNYATEGLNNFRTNRQPGNQFAAADAVLSLEPNCDGSGIFAVVRNLGEAVLPAGTGVTLSAGTLDAPGVTLASAETTIPLYPAQAESIAFDVPDDIAAGTRAVNGRVRPVGGTPECREDNNTTEGLVGSCLR